MKAAIVPSPNGARVVPAPESGPLDGKTADWMEDVSSEQYQEGA
jgi:hypothetical protein